MTAMSGASESWFLSAYPTWADYEKANKAGESPALAAISKQYSSQEGEYLSDGRGMVLTFREDLSFGGPADLPASRYFSVTRISVRPGQAAAFEENRKLVKAAHESAKLSDKFSIWQAAAGAPAGTYFIFVARKSMGEIDEGAALHGAAYQAALGGEEAQKKMNANASAATFSRSIASTTSLATVRPKWRAGKLMAALRLTEPIHWDGSRSPSFNMPAWRSLATRLASTPAQGISGR